ncbi:hypothetical protein YC2023_014540 [Brassica napus]
MLVQVNRSSNDIGLVCKLSTSLKPIRSEHQTITNDIRRTQLDTKLMKRFAATRTHAAASTSPSLRINMGNQPSVHSDPPELTDSTPSPPPTVFDRSEPNFKEPTTAELNVASTSRGHEPASTELTEPPPPGDKTKKPQKELHRAFLTTTAPLHQNQIRHGRPFSRAQARRRREETSTKRRSKTFKGGFRGSGNSTHAYVPADHQTQR